MKLECWVQCQKCHRCRGPTLVVFVPRHANNAAPKDEALGDDGKKVEEVGRWSIVYCHDTCQKSSKQEPCLVPS
jgi:hypothetical protein